MAAPILSGCKMDVLDPAGPIASQEKTLIIVATCLMLIIVVPVLFMIAAFTLRYRAGNTKHAYTPDWEHSNQIELVVWIVPCLIIIALGAVTWVSTHRLDPYRHIESSTKPLEVEVVSLDWKWLFIYPDQHVASVNELAMPAGTPVHFHLTSATVMNSFFIPRLGTQIYTMPGMDTKLQLLASHPGAYQGISANFSGDGFSDMNFKAVSMTPADFAKWVQTAQASQNVLNLASYRQLAAPSERLPVSTYSNVEPTLYHDILNECANGAQCMDKSMKMTMLDRAAGGAPAHCNPPKSKGL
jgi:cytochrome o ubiquinol oxidase subunit 2